jgi:hypothetical protein
VGVFATHFHRQPHPLATGERKINNVGYVLGFRTHFEEFDLVTHVNNLRTFFIQF